MWSTEVYYKSSFIQAKAQGIIPACNSCAYWNNDGKNIEGYCCLNGPVTGEQKWPVTDESEFCGQWEPDATEEASDED